MTSTPPAVNGRLLSGWAQTGHREDLAAHLARHRPLPAMTKPAVRRRLLDEVTRSGLTGRGGGAFPTGRKLATVAASGRTVVVGNACEGDPASDKGQLLAELVPHLVLDGLRVAAALVNTDRIYLCAHRGGPTYAALENALAERADWTAIRLVDGPDRFVASEESALVNLINGGEARPTGRATRVYERGVSGRATFVGNVETLAHLALIARFGAQWFRGAGTAADTGTALVTLGGAVHRPGVVEVAYGTTLGQLLDIGGGPTEPIQALLVGGCSGTWLRWPAPRLPYTHADLAAIGVSMGVGSIFALPERSCGVTETARLLHYLAAESARQCGPCMFGLPAIAADLAALASGSVDGPLHARLQRRLKTVNHRGACTHPDGAVRLAQSALDTFAVDVQAHLVGRPCRWAGTPTRLPLPRPDLAVSR